MKLKSLNCKSNTKEHLTYCKWSQEGIRKQTVKSSYVSTGLFLDPRQTMESLYNKFARHPSFEKLDPTKTEVIVYR